MHVGDRVRIRGNRGWMEGLKSYEAEKRLCGRKKQE